MSRHSSHRPRLLDRLAGRARRRRWLAFEPLESRAVPAVFYVTTNADSGPGSLRVAINEADVISTIESLLNV